MKDVAVALLTCDRAEYTERTVDSFMAHNDASRFLLLHADDASEDPRVGAIVQAAGFETVAYTTRRRGIFHVRTALIDAAAARAPWILVLENDIESLRPFPWALFDYVRARPAIDCLRLYGRFKDRAGRQPCLTTDKGNGNQPVDWRPLKGAPEASQVGVIHWSAQPAVTRSEAVRALHLTGRKLTGLTARVKKNVMAHIGVERTPGRVL